MTLVGYFIILYQFQPTMDRKTTEEEGFQRETLGRFLTDLERLKPGHWYFKPDEALIWHAMPYNRIGSSPFLSCEKMGLLSPIAFPIPGSGECFNLTTLSFVQDGSTSTEFFRGDF